MRQWVRRPRAFGCSILAINTRNGGQKLSNLEFQIEGFFEAIGLPKHGAFIAHGLKNNSGENEVFWKVFEGVSSLAGVRWRAADPRL